MANTKISNLTGAASVTDNSVFPVVDSGSTKKVTGTQIRTYARSGLSTVAVSGSYTDLTNKPTIFDGNYNSLTNKPTLFDGAYASLTGKPTLFDGNYNSLTNKPSLFDGSYNSLTDTPTLFDSNYDSLTNKPIISDTTGLTSGAFFIAKDSTTIQLGQWAAQAITIGSSGIQIAGTGGVEIAGVAGAGVTLGGETSGTITFTSATSGINYNDLTNKPTIPADISDLTDTNSLLGQGGGGGFSGNYSDLTGAPDLSGYVTGTPWQNEGYVTGTPWNDQGFITSASIPTIPSSLSDLGITAGSDGQVLKLNSSLIPVWSTPVDTGNFTFSGDTLTSPTNGLIKIANTDDSAGIHSLNDRGRMWFDTTNNFNLVVDNTYQFSIMANGKTTFGGGYTFPNVKGTTGQVLVTDNSGNLTWQDQASGGGGGASTGSITFVDNSILGTSDVTIGFDIVASPAVNFSFTTSGVFIAPAIETSGPVSIGGASIHTTDRVQCLPNVDTVVYTSTSDLTATIKALFQVDGYESDVTGYDAQSCEMMVAQMGQRVSGSVYGLAYTSNAPLATFNARWNSTSNLIEILCRPASTTASVYVRTSATEMLTSA